MQEREQSEINPKQVFRVRPNALLFGLVDWDPKLVFLDPNPSPDPAFFKPRNGTYFQIG